MQNPIFDIIRNRNAARIAGIYSACTASEYVIEAVMESAAQTDTYALVEATANQVNQFGGYTGMNPTQFAQFVFCIADRISFPRDRVILGGDHLGPLIWQGDDEAQAMAKSAELVRQYVLAGFTKIHLDTSMRLKCDDINSRLSDDVIARRAAVLARVAGEAAEDFWGKKCGGDALVLVIGSEVPIPGGAVHDEQITVTEAKDLKATIKSFRKAFEHEGVECLWENVIAVVVQPGVEFGDASVHEYSSDKAKALTAMLDEYPDLVFEGHSTDYQPREALRAMVRDGIAILKVGPALTFYQREAFFALEKIETEMATLHEDIVPSSFSTALEQVMTASPSGWSKHYHGSETELAFKRKYSYSDRSRYYMQNPEIKNSIRLLMDNLSRHEIPLTLISQYMPIQAANIRNNIHGCDPYDLLRSRIRDVISDYTYAVLR